MREDSDCYIRVYCVYGEPLYIRLGIASELCGTIYRLYPDRLRGDTTERKRERAKECDGEADRENNQNEQE